MKREDVKVRNAKIVDQYSEKYEIWIDMSKVRKRSFVTAAKKLSATLITIRDT